MQTLTPEELQKAKDLKASGLTTDEIFTRLASARTNTPLANSYTPIESLGGLSPTQKDIGQTFTDIGGSFKKFAGNINRAVTQEGLSLPQRAVGGALTVPTLALDVTGDLLMGGLRTAAPEAVEQKTAQAVTAGVGKAMETDFVQGVMNWYDSQSPEEQYTTSQIIMPLAETLAETTTGGIFGKILSRGRKAAPDRKMVEEAVGKAVREAETGNIAPATRIVNATIDPVERQAAVDNLTRSYMSSMVEDRTAINNRLDDLAEQRSRFSDERITRETLISNLANEGYIPVPEGRRARFEDSLYDVQQRQSALMNDMEGVLQEVRDTISTKEFYDQVRTSLRNDPRIGTDINAALRRVDELEAGARTTYGDTLRAVDVNRLKVEGNQKRADVGKNVDPVITDAWSNIARVGNEWLNSRINDDLFQRTNAEWSRLQTLQDTMRVLNNQQIDVGLLGRALGSYLAVVTGGSAGMAAGGAGALVVAGILSKMGADTVADMLRRRMFNPETTAIIRNVMRNDDALREQLLREAKTMEARNTLEDFTRALPPAREGAPRSQIESGTPIQVVGETPRGRVEPGITERTREGAVQRSDSEPQPTVVEEALSRDKAAVDQALLEMEVEIEARPDISGGNMAQTTEGEYYRFRSIPVWVPEGLRDGALLDKVMKNISEGKQPRSNATNEIELQKVVEEYISKRVEELKNNPQDRGGVFSGDVAFAAALMAGGTYYLSTQDEEMLPVVGMAALMANPKGRKMIAKQAADGKLQKLPVAEKRAIAEALESYDTAPMTISRPSRASASGKLEMINLDGGDADFRLSQLKDKNANGTFTDADAIEAKALLEDRGVLGKAQSATTKTTDLPNTQYKNKELNFVYNTKKADFGDQDFAQDIEPAGRYMNVGFDEFPGGNGMVKGTVTFKNPLVIDWKTSRTGGWKTKLSERYSGKTGKELSQAIIDDGYDGIIAVSDDVPREAVNLQTFRGTTDLLEEARKMKAEGKTFEEFVGAQRENTFIHGTNKKIEGGLELKSKALGVAEPESNAVDALFVTPSDDVGVMHSRMYTKRDGKLYSVKLKPNAKIFDYSNPEHRKLLDGKLSDVQQRLIERYLIDGQLYWAATPPPKLIKKLGFDGMRAVERKAGESAFSETFGDTVYPKNAESIAIFNKNAFTEVDTLTDKQLKDIWLKAN